jgi:HPt (histidine-containing phosphotransfer) domain-containing protein
MEKPQAKNQLGSKTATDEEIKSLVAQTLESDTTAPEEFGLEQQTLSDTDRQEAERVAHSLASRAGLIRIARIRLPHAYQKARKQKANPGGLAKCLNFMAPRPGLEPGTYGLTVRRSTN